MSVTSAPPTPASEPSSDSAQVDWVPLVSLPEEIEATLAAGFLENEGIQCVIESRYFSQEPTNLSVLGSFVLFVHEDAADRAKSLLEDRLNMPVADAESRGQAQQDLDALLEGKHSASEEE